MKSKSKLLPIALSVSALLLAQPSFGQFGNLLKKNSATQTEQQSGQMDLGEYNGVKHALGVTDFENQAGYRSQWQLGENLALMLESALSDSGRFVIVDRQELGDIMVEQDLQASGRAAAAKNVAQSGLIRSAKYIATGAITRADASTQGDGGGIRIRGIRLGGSSSKAEVEVVVKLIDTTTSEVVASERVLGKAGSKKINIGLSHRGVNANLNSFATTPIGEAAQDCISAAVEFIAHEMEDYKITANVVMAPSEDRIVINRGENYNIREGNVFTIREEGEMLVDPTTGEILDMMEGEDIGKIEVTKVTEKVSYCKLVEGQMPERGAQVALDG